MRGGVFAALAIFATLLAASPAHAASICWAKTPVSSDWNTPANWNGGVLPGPSDVAVFNAESADCSSPAQVTLSGATAEVAFVEQATTTLTVEGTTLTLIGNSIVPHLLGTVQVRNGGTLTVASGANILAGGTVTLGNPLDVTVGGTLLIDGALRSTTGALAITDEPAGGGLVKVGEGGNLIYEPGNSGAIRAQFANTGNVILSSDASSSSELAIYPSSGSPDSTGQFMIADQSTLALRPTRGSTMVASGSITGAGRLAIDSSVGPAGTGVVSVPAAATLAVGELTIGAPSALDLAADATVNHLVMTQAGERRGAGTLTAQAANLSGGVLSGGLTKVTGGAAITGDAANPTVRGNAKLRTEGATTWSGGAVTLGGAGVGGTWENAGTLTINNTDTGSGNPDLRLAAGDPAGVLRNLAGATINRGVPAGTMFGAARIENAGTVNVLAGTMGEPSPGASGAYVQSSGVTTIAADATLSMNATLDGGTLRGSGTVRSLVNSGGTVAPGLSPGTLMIAEDFTQGPGGALAEEIAGPLDAQYDRLLVGGTASLAGTLAITSDPGYVPAPQSVHHFLTAAARTGSFASLTGARVGDGSYAADYLADGAQLCFAGCVATPVTHKLSVTLSGSGSGTVTSDVGGLVCAPDCERAFSPDAVVTLTASPAAGSAFSGWSEPCGGAGSCLLAMDQARAVTATFSTQPATPQQPSTSPTGSSAKTTIKANDVIRLPSTKRCVRGRKLSLRVRVPAGLTARRATVVVRGRQVKVVGKAGLGRSFVVRTPRSGSFTVKVALTLAGGRVVRASGRYHACS